jgi:hypothetical protein
LQDISAAIAMIDDRFSAAAVECQPARGAGAATLLGAFGEFFRRMELGREYGSGCNLSTVPVISVEQCVGGCGGNDRASPKLEQARTNTSSNKTTWQWPVCAAFLLHAY